MSNLIMNSEESIDAKLIKDECLSEKKCHRDVFPKCGNISAGILFYDFIPRPQEPSVPEFVYIPINPNRKIPRKSEWAVQNLIAEWNICWEIAQERPEFFSQTNKLPQKIQWLHNHPGRNIYLLPGKPFSRYYAYVPLYHLIPAKTLKRFGLPLLKHGTWPYLIDQWAIERNLPSDFESRLSQAFAFHVWPLLSSRSRIWAYSESEPLRVLAHNLDFWMPFSYRVSEQRVREFGRCRIENQKQSRRIEKLRGHFKNEVLIDRPLMGGTLWEGEEEAWEVTKTIVELADSKGKLRAIMDAIKSNRVEEDFSSCWSNAREDFERKLYRKRSKVRVKFVEIDDTIPVHGPNSEVHENLLWQDFISILNIKERQIVVLLRNGITKLTEIGEKRGYANHSPVSKSLKGIRQKALDFIKN